MELTKEDELQRRVNDESPTQRERGAKQVEHPQSLSVEDEELLDEAWATVAFNLDDLDEIEGAK